MTNKGRTLTPEEIAYLKTKENLDWRINCLVCGWVSPSYKYLDYTRPELYEIAQEHFREHHPKKESRVGKYIKCTEHERDKIAVGDKV